MEIGKTFCGRTDGRTDVRPYGWTHLSSNLLGHRRGDDLMNIELTFLCDGTDRHEIQAKLSIGVLYPILIQEF